MMDKTQVIIGSEWFLLPEPSAEELREQARGMAASGQKVARIFLYWNEFLQKYDDTWSFDFYDDVFRAAEENGLQLTVTLNPATIPRWLRNREGGPQRNSFVNPAMWALALDYVRRVVERYHHSPALHSWILENEPTLRDRPNVHMIERFRQVLREKYGTIENFNAQDIRSFYMSFDDIGIIHADGSAELNTYMDHGKGYLFQIEWFDYCCRLLEGRMADVSRVIRSIDTVHPTSSNPTALFWGHPAMGQNIFRQGDLVDFLGNSSHPAWDSHVSPDNKNYFVSARADLTRSATRDADGVFWTTELQAGNTVFSGSEQGCATPTADEINHWLWEIVGAGGRGIVYWLWRTRKRGWEGLEWGLSDLYGGPSERSLQTASVARILGDNSALFASVRPPRPDARVLYSHHSINLAHVEGSADKGSPRSRDQHSDALVGAYAMLRDLGYTTLFADEADTSGIAGLPAGSLLVVPGAYALETETVAALAAFVEKGGTLVTDGLFALKDRYGRQQLEAQPMVARLLGACLSDIVTTQQPISLTVNGRSAPGWFVQNRFRDFTTGRVIGAYGDGQPAVLLNELGKGRVIHIGTKFFEAYIHDPRADARELLSGLLPPRRTGVLRLCNPGPGLCLKLLEGSGGSVAVLLNHRSAGCVAEIYNAGSLSLLDLQSGETLRLAAGSFANIPLSPMQVRVFKVAAHTGDAP